MLTLYILAPLAALTVLVWLSHRTGHRAYPLKMRRVELDASGRYVAYDSSREVARYRQTLAYAETFGHNENEEETWD